MAAPTHLTDDERAIMHNAIAILENVHKARTASALFSILTAHTESVICDGQCAYTASETRCNLRPEHQGRHHAGGQRQSLEIWWT